MSPQSIAVIGSGISGLSAAWLLSRRHRVTLYEADRKCGGHANTIDVETAEGRIAVDTGFIVYNERNYPNLTALFAHLGVPTQPTSMTFAFTQNGGAYEYSGSAAGSFGQPANLFKREHWRLMADVARFFRTAELRVSRYPETTTLGAFLKNEGYSAAFIENHIVPMGAAIWSTTMTRMLAFPASSFIRFYANHGLLKFGKRPQWRTVSGGSRVYVDRLLCDSRVEVVRGNPIARVVRRTGHVQMIDQRGVVRPFDQVVIATHADQALRLLDEADPVERRLLGAFSYQSNRAVLHRDPRWMPRRRNLWSSWNYIKTSGGTESGLCMTYWMNQLQGLPTRTNLFVTLNPDGVIHPKAVDASFDYAHPVFDDRAVAAQRDLWALQGRHRTWFCGSYFGHGFHEDGAQSGLAVAEAAGGVRRPWRVADGSARIALPDPGFNEAAE